MLKFNLLLIVVRLLLLSTCNSMSVFKRGQFQGCSRRLAEALQMVCERRGGYNGPDENANRSGKRNYIPPYLSRTDTYSPWHVSFPHEYLSNSPYGSYNHPLEMLLNKRQQRGVVDECCRQSCSYNVLETYCLNSISTEKN